MRTEMTPEQKQAFVEKMKLAKSKKTRVNQTVVNLTPVKQDKDVVEKSPVSKTPQAPALHINQESYLSIDQLKRLVPAAFSDHPAGTVSGKYQFINTAEIITRLMKEGFGAVRASQNNARNEDTRMFTRHMIRFRQNKIKPIVGEVFPEVIVVNGHNGGVTFEMRGGLFRLVCSNGLVTSVADRMNTTTKHLGDDIGTIIEGAYRVIENMSDIEETIKAMKGHTLTNNKLRDFVKGAAILAYGEGHLLCEKTDPLLVPRRVEDSDSSLWSVFNRVQENIMRGGIEYQSASGRAVTTKGITRVKREIEFNNDLWSAAERLIGRDYILG